MKKLLLLFCLALVLTGGVFADHPNDEVGVGLFLGGGWASVGGGLFNPGFSLKVPRVPLFWGFNASFGSVTGLSVSADYYLVDRDLIKDGSFDLDWFLGVGLFSHLYFGDNFTMALGVRLPIGLSWHINRVFELFLDVAPGIGLKFDSNPFYGSLAADLGLRVWI
ncbi:MAG: hypothetical protein LBB77_06915 [Treponema sp.]|nr:hypothetical protein [Treponema sp.]